MVWQGLKPRPKKEPTIYQAPNRLRDQARQVIQQAFLENLAKGWSATKAFEQLAEQGHKTNWMSLYIWRKEDEAFAQAWFDAIEMGTDRLEDEAFRRAHDGVPRDIYYKGRVVGTIRDYSDMLLLAMLKARRGQLYRDREQLPAPPAVVINIDQKELEQAETKLIEQY